MQNESLCFQNACPKNFHPIVMVLLGYVLECLYLRKFGYLRCRYKLEQLGVKFRGDGFLGEIWFPNMIVVYKCCVIATYHYCLQMFWFLRSWVILIERMVAHPFPYSLSRFKLSKYRSYFGADLSETFWPILFWMVAVKCLMSYHLCYYLSPLLNV